MKAIALSGIIVVSLVLRQPLLVTLLAAAAAMHAFWGRGNLEDIIEDMWVGLDKEVILSIPLFILCGGVMSRGSIAERLVALVTSLTKPLPGGLAVATILSCAVFAAISGSSIVTMLAIGTVMYPAMLKAGYDNRFTLGAIMAGGTLGIIIPPSIPMLIYALVTESSVADLFRGGIGPGLLITAALSTYAIWFNRRLPTHRIDFAEVRHAMRRGVWALMMPVILLGGIYSGYFTPTEAAAIALVYAILVEVFVHREMKLGDFYTIVLDTSKLGGSLFPVLAVALSLNILLIEHRVPQAMIAASQDYINSPLLFMVIVNIVLLFVGCLMTTGEAILVMGPLLAPLAASYGYDKVTFGIIMILNLEIGFLTPPVGLNLIVAMTAFRQPFLLLCHAAVPFIIIMLLCLMAIVLMPGIATFFIR